jgi:hypothetical protein
MCKHEKNFAFFIVIKWHKMFIDAILMCKFVSEYVVKSYKVALFVIKILDGMDGCKNQKSWT